MQQRPQADMNTDEDTMMRSSEDGSMHVGLTHHPLSILDVMALVRSPTAGALVMFAGTQSRPLELMVLILEATEL